MLPPVTKEPKAWTTSPASPFAKIKRVEAIESTSLNIVPIRIIDGNAASSRGFCTYSEIINNTMPRVMFKLMEKFITQLGISISNIKIKMITNTARKISLIGFDCAFCCAIL